MDAVLSLPVLVPLGVAVLAGMLKVFSQRLAWRRESRHDALAGVVASADTFQEALGAAWMAARGADGASPVMVQAVLPSVIEAGQDYRIKWRSASLVCSFSVLQAGSALEKWCLVAAHGLRDERDGGSSFAFEEWFTHWKSEFANLIAASRRQLGVSSFLEVLAGYAIRYWGRYKSPTLSPELEALVREVEETRTRGGVS